MVSFLGLGDLGLIALIVAIAACAQMVSGFGFALMAVPMMGLAVDLKTAVVVSTICGTGSNTFQAIKDGRSRDDRLVRLLVAASFLGMPFGIVVLDRVELDALRVAIGIFVLLALVSVMKEHGSSSAGGRPLEFVAGFLSGVLATSTSTNGPPLVLLLRSRGLAPEVFRATINTVFSVVSITSIATFAVAGKITATTLFATVVALPGLACGMYAGARLRGALSPEAFWRLVALLLAATAVSSILTGLL